MEAYLQKCKSKIVVILNNYLVIILVTWGGAQIKNFLNITIFKTRYNTTYQNKSGLNLFSLKIVCFFMHHLHTFTKILKDSYVLGKVTFHGNLPIYNNYTRTTEKEEEKQLISFKPYSQL